MVIHKSLRDFRTRLRNNQDRHGRKEHIHRERERETLQVSVLPYRCSICAPLVSVLVVAQSSSEILEGLMNKPSIYVVWRQRVNMAVLITAGVTGARLLW